MNSYDVVLEAPLYGVVVSNTRASKGVEMVLIHAWKNSDPNVIPLVQD